MGSGKTSVGALVADALGCPFLDLDELIVHEAGCSIPEIFAREGEEGFRKREAETLKKTVGRYGQSTAVLALGGGTPCLPGAAQLLREKSLCIWLRAQAETLEARLAGERDTRPMLKTRTLEELLAEREKDYLAAAHLVLDTDGLSPAEIADEIIISCL